MNLLLRTFRLLFLLGLSASALTGCATYESWPGGSRSEQDQPPAPVVRQPPAPAQTSVDAPEPPLAPPAPESTTVKIEPPPGPAGFLLDQAESHRRGGDLAAAATSIERAMRIQPGNPWLSYKLAEIRLDQGNATQAELLAQRALAQAGADRSFTALCWNLTAAARDALGNQRGAADALARASEASTGATR